MLLLCCAKLLMCKKNKCILKIYQKMHSSAAFNHFLCLASCKGFLDFLRYFTCEIQNQSWRGLLKVIYSNSFTMKGHAQPVPVSHHPCCTDLFLIYNLNLPSSSLKSFLSPQILLKIVPFFPGAPLWILKG